MASLLGPLSDRAPKDTVGVVHLLDTWARVSQRAPEPGKAVGYIAGHNGMRARQVEHMRQVRNCCAHTDGGWPAANDLTEAIGTAYALSQFASTIRLVAFKPQDRQQAVAHRRIRAYSDRAPTEPMEAKGVVDLMDTWARLRIAAPDPTKINSGAASRNLLDFDTVAHMREVRNCCAHPDQAGWPSRDDLTQACMSAYTLKQLVLGHKLSS